MLLTDICRISIDTCKSAYVINPHYSHSFLSFLWKAGLKYTRVKLEYIPDDSLDNYLKTTCEEDLHLFWLTAI